MTKSELDPKMPQVLMQFLTASLTKHQKSRFLMQNESASQKLKPRISRLRDAYMEYESTQLASRLKQAQTLELTKSEILKFAEPKTKVTRYVDPTSSEAREFTAHFGQGSPVYKY